MWLLVCVPAAPLPVCSPSLVSGKAVEDGLKNAPLHTHGRPGKSQLLAAGFSLAIIGPGKGGALPANARSLYYVKDRVIKI